MERDFTDLYSSVAVYSCPLSLPSAVAVFAFVSEEQYRSSSLLVLGAVLAHDCGLCSSRLTSVVAGAFSSFNARLATKSFSSQLQL